MLTQRSNLTPQWAKILQMIYWLWYRSGFRCKAGLLHTFPLFCPKTHELESAVYSQQKNFCLAQHFCWMHREKLISMKEDLFSQLAERTSRALPVYLYTDHEHYVINQRSTFFEKEQNHGGWRQDCFSV